MWAALTQALSQLIADELGQLGAQVAVRLEVPPRRELGDVAWSGVLALAKELRRPPRELASELAPRLEEKLAAAPASSPLAWLAPQVRVDGPGFLNFRLRRAATLAAALRPLSTGLPPKGEKVIVEHTNINPNKAAHIGHLRNAVLGDVLVRCLRFLGFPVEVHNYVDDTGVQVADVVVGFCFLPEATLVAAVKSFWPGLGTRREVLEALARRWQEDRLVDPKNPQGDFDDLCWQLYPQVTAWYERESAAQTYRQQVLHALEAGAPPTLTLPQAVAQLAEGQAHPAAIARVAAVIAEANLRCHLLTMGALGVTYDLLPHESDILQLGFWQRTFAWLREKGVVRLEQEGKNAGCWVMPLEEAKGEETADKILVRSNGTATYTAKDIAYQLWKLGLVRDAQGKRLDFGYRPFARYHQEGPAAPVLYGQGERVLYRTCPERQEAAPSFGAGQRVYNVIDVRQSYPQTVVREAVKALGFPREAACSVHFAYEMVALTPKAVRQLEATLGVSFGLSPEEESKAYVEMSGRRGLGVKADELLATLLAEAEKAIAERNQGQLPADGRERARAIAVGALRYQMARQSRNRVLAFDFAEALAFEGDTGPYLQYAAVRARKIFEKLTGAGLAWQPETAAHALAGEELPDDLWALVLACLRTPEVVEKAVASLEFSLLAAHARELAQSFHNLYHRYPVLHAESEQARLVRAACFHLFLRTLEHILESLLGIPVPKEM